MATIRERIKDLRTEKGYTQEDLALKLGLNSKSNIANYENGANSPSDKIKYKMCEIFDCSMDYLMGKSDYKNIDIYMSSNISYIINRLSNRELQVVNCILKNISTSQISDILPFVKTEINKYNVIPKELLSSLIIYLYKNNLLTSNFLLKPITETEPKQFFMTPVYGQISAGQPNWAEECIEGRIPIDPNLMNIVNPDECYFLRIHRKFNGQID